jgi:hypothetical protein
MIGNDVVGPGVMVLTMRDIFEAMRTRSEDTKFDVVCSYLEVGRDNDRFDHSSSIDVQMADKSVVHAPPSMYSPGWSPKLLVFPPSAETQYEMNG